MWKVGLGIIVFFIFIVIFAPLLTKYDPNRTVTVHISHPLRNIGLELIGWDETYFHRLFMARDFHYG